MKQSKATRELEKLEARLADNRRQDTEVVRAYEAAQEDVRRLRQELAAAVREESLAIDGSVPSGSRTQKHGGDLAAAEAKVASSAWATQRHGLFEARQLLENQRGKLATEGYEEIVADLEHEAEPLAEETRDLVAKVAELRGRWQKHQTRWLWLERALGGSLVRGRHDIPAFPVEVTGDPAAKPVPELVTESDAASNIPIPTA